jgi:Fe-S cluster assembly protein SufD
MNANVPTNVRTMKTAAEQALADTFAGAQRTLPGKGAVAALRADAFQRFETAGLPHRRVEEWKYTDLRALMREAQPLADAPDAAAKAKAKTAGALFAGIDARKLVFVDGVFVPDLSDLSAEAGLTVTSMAAALAKGDALVTAHVGKTVETNDVGVALNTALMGDGAVIHVAAGSKIEKPIHLVFFGSQAAASVTRSLLVVENGASVTLLESHDSAAGQANTALEIVAGDGASVDHVKAVNAGALHLSSLMASVGASAQFNTFAFTTGSALTRNQMFLRFAGKDTRANIGGATLARGREHVDNTLLIDHAARGCESRERFRAVLDGESRGVFQGKITVQPHAQKTDAKMASHSLLLSDEAEANAKPELEIFADDVQCGHGATVGALQQDLLFYLRARGIPKKEAEALLIQSFVAEPIEAVAHEGVRAALNGAVERWLAGRA